MRIYRVGINSICMIIDLNNIKRNYRGEQYFISKYLMEFLERVLLWVFLINLKRL